MAILCLGLALFIANHLLVSFRDARAALIARLGRPLYHALFGLVSLIALVLIGWGYADYRATGYMQIWSPPLALRHVTVGLMLITSVLVVASLIPSHIQAGSRFPLLAAVKVWAFAHLLANGDLGSIVMFGALLAWAIYAGINARHRKDVAVSAAPLGWSNDVIVVLGGIALYLALGFLFHPYVIGVPVFVGR